MGRIILIKSAEHIDLNDAKNTSVIVDSGGRPFVTTSLFSAPGEDALPLPTDYGVIVSTAGEGTNALVGVLDPINERKTAFGERRLYARDPVDGVGVVEIWLQNDGTVTISNENGQIQLKADGESNLQNAEGSYTLAADGAQLAENSNGNFGLQADGKFFANGTIIDTNGDIFGAGIIQDGSGIQLSLHTHQYITPLHPGPAGQTGNSQ